MWDCGGKRKPNTKDSDGGQTNYGGRTLPDRPVTKILRILSFKILNFEKESTYFSKKK